MAEVFSPTACVLTGSFEVTWQLTSMLFHVKSLQKDNIDSLSVKHFCLQFFFFSHVFTICLHFFLVLNDNKIDSIVSKITLTLPSFRSKRPWNIIYLRRKQGHHWIFNYNSCRCTFSLQGQRSRSESTIVLVLLKVQDTKLPVDCRRFVYKNKNISRKRLPQGLSALTAVCNIPLKKLTEMKINWLKNSRERPNLCLGR